MARSTRRSANQPALKEAGDQQAGAATHPPCFAVSRSVNDMVGDDLKAYARKVGISERDVLGLSESRLRQNCIVMAHENLENI